MAVRGTRSLTKGNMVLNDQTPLIEVAPDTFKVRVDGKEIDLTPAKSFALGQLYWFS